MTALPSSVSRCGRCGAAYPPGAFADLTPVHTFAGEDLTAHVVRWPEDIIVDVRNCAHCQTPIARLTRQRA